MVVFCVGGWPGVWRAETMLSSGPSRPILCSAFEGLINSSKHWTRRLEAGKQTSQHLVGMAGLLRTAPHLQPTPSSASERRDWEEHPLPSPLARLHGASLVGRGRGRGGPHRQPGDGGRVRGGDTGLDSGSARRPALGRACVFSPPPPSATGGRLLAGWGSQYPSLAGRAR